MNVKDLTLEQLEEHNRMLQERRDDIHREQKMIARVLDARRAEAAAADRLKKMTPAERAAMQRALAPAGNA